MKKIILLSLLFIFGAISPIKAQFQESKERKKLWGGKSARKHKNREAFNPYLDKKHKPSEELAKQNKREQKRQLKGAKKQKRRSMKKLGIKPTKVKKA